MRRQHEPRPLADIPNAEGYAFTGVRHDGSFVSCTVAKDGSGMHHIKELPITELKGWWRLHDERK